MHHAEDRRRRADAKRNRQRRNRGEGRGLGELAYGEAGIIAALEHPSHASTLSTTWHVRPLDGFGGEKVCSRGASDVRVTPAGSGGCALSAAHLPARAWPLSSAWIGPARGPCCSAMPPSPPRRASLRQRVQDGCGCIPSDPRRRSQVRRPRSAPRRTSVAGPASARPCHAFRPGSVSRISDRSRGNRGGPCARSPPPREARAQSGGSRWRSASYATDSTPSLFGCYLPRLGADCKQRARSSRHLLLRGVSQAPPGLRDRGWRCCRSWCC